MSTIARSQELLAGAIAYFVEEGTVIPDGGGAGVPLTVSINAKPVFDLENNWPRIPCIQKMESKKDRDDFGARKCYDPASNIYLNEPRKKTTRRFIEFTLEETNEIVQRLSEGVVDPIESGVAQRPNQDPTERIYGWLKVQQRDIDLVQDHNVLDTYGYFELEDIPSVEGKYQEPVLMFTRVESLGNAVSWV